jgi:alpha-beta hydrolase superfamily lysophospholipase
VLDRGSGPPDRRRRPGASRRHGRTRAARQAPGGPTQRPFDAGALAAEVSPVAGVDLDQGGDLLVSQVKQLGAGAPVTVVAHSMGGAVLTRAGSWPRS